MRAVSAELEKVRTVTPALKKDASEQKSCFGQATQRVDDYNARPTAASACTGLPKILLASLAV